MVDASRKSSTESASLGDLSWRLRTCSAHLGTIEISEILRDDQMEAIIHARRLLSEAADALDKAIPVTPEGELIIDRLVPPSPPSPQQPRASQGAWIGDDLKPVPNPFPSRNACPNCDSRTTKMVRAAGPNIELECPVCSFRWQR